MTVNLGEGNEGQNPCHARERGKSLRGRNLVAMPGRLL